MCKEQIKYKRSLIVFRLGNDPLQLKKKIHERVEKRKAKVLDVHPSHIVPTKIYGGTSGFPINIKQLLYLAPKTKKRK